MTAPARFRQADVERAVAGALKAGARLKEVRIDPNSGAIRLFTDDVEPADDDWRSQQPLYRRA